MIRDPTSFQLLLHTIARFVREKLIPRERESFWVSNIVTLVAP